MKLRKYFMLGLALFLMAVSCSRKEAENKKELEKSVNNNENAPIGKEALESQMSKYNNYNDLKKVPESEEWIKGFGETYIMHSSDGKGNFKKPSSEGIEEIIGNEEGVDLLAEYIKDLGETAKEEPKIEGVDKEALNLVKALNDEKGLIIEILNYYKNKEYEKDAFQKGKELFEKYTAAAGQREKSYRSYARGVDELYLQIGERLLSVSEKEGQVGRAAMIRYMSHVNRFSVIAFSGNSLQFSRDDLSKLKESYRDMESSYKSLEEVTGEDIVKEKMDMDEFQKMRTASKEVQENADKFIKAVESNSKPEIAQYASMFINGHSRTVDSYNIISKGK